VYNKPPNLSPLAQAVGFMLRVEARIKREHMEKKPAAVLADKNGCTAATQKKVQTEYTISTS
jgi:hypothetical protein